MPIIVREVHLSRRLRSQLAYSLPGTELSPLPAEPASRHRPRKHYRNPILLAQEWQRKLIEEGLSRADLAGEMGRSRARVTQVLHLLDLDAEVVEAVAKLGDPLPDPVVSERSLRLLLRLSAGKQMRRLQEALAGAG